MESTYRFDRHYGSLDEVVEGDKCVFKLWACVESAARP